MRPAEVGSPVVKPFLCYDHVICEGRLTYLQGHTFCEYANSMTEGSALNAVCITVYLGLKYCLSTLDVSGHRVPIAAFQTSPFFPALPKILFPLDVSRLLASCAHERRHFWAPRYFCEISSALYKMFTGR
jgi:hypothetical protein